MRVLRVRISIVAPCAFEVNGHSAFLAGARTFGVQRFVSATASEDEGGLTMAFAQNDLETYFATHSLQHETREFLRAAAVGPSRDVGTTGYRSVVTEYQSRKMGTSLATESRRGELAVALELEYDPTVLAYYEQVPPVDCARTNRKGIVCQRVYRADFIVLRTDGPIVYEVKSADKLDALQKLYPSDWFSENGHVVDRPASNAFRLLALPHRVVSTADLPVARTANLRLLLQARNQPQLSDALQRGIESVLKKAAATTIAELAKRVGIEDLTPILQLIDKGRLVAELGRSLISDPASCWVATSAEILAAARESHEYVRANKSTVTGAAIPPEKQAKRALEILEELKTNPTSRNSRRMRKRIADAESEGKPAFLAVTPRNYRSGNTKAKRPESVLRYAESSVERHWEKETRPSVATAYRNYKFDARRDHPGIAPVSRVTFQRMIAKRDRAGAARARGGNREANRVEQPSAVSDRVLKPTRPFELATCDHCLLKIFCVVVDDGKYVYVQQPWLTVLRDIYSGALLAWWISFKSPSRLACAMVLRSCLRRHGRLPEGIIVDRGPEFRSVYFSALLAHCTVDLHFRPTSNPRYGSEAERAFGEFKTLWLDARPGNKTEYPNARAVSSDHSPQALATLSLPNLLQEFGQFSAWLNLKIAPTRTQSPSVLTSLGLRQFPCSGVAIPYDETFVIASSVDARRFKVDSSRGLKIGEAHFWHPALATPGLHQTKLRTRVDPEESAVAYAYVRDTWVACESSRSPLIDLKDPVHRLAEAIVFHTGKAARAAARDCAENELVRQLRQADSQYAGAIPAPRQPPPSGARPQESNTVDHFESIRDAPVESPKLSAWGNK